MFRFSADRNDYLEQKKKAFPRFYFVANGALLDILSNGNKPLKATWGYPPLDISWSFLPNCQVAEYLGDVFDGIREMLKSQLTSS